MAGETTETAEGAKDPLTIDSNKRIIPVIENLSAVVQAPVETPLRTNDISSRQSVLGNMGVHSSWYTENELAGKDEVTSWPAILREADNDKIRRKGAKIFKEKADLRKPITQPENLSLLQDISTYEQQQKRKIAEEKRVEAEKAAKAEADRIKNLQEREQESLARKQRITERKRLKAISDQEAENKKNAAADAERAFLEQRVVEAKKQGEMEAQRLAGMIYDPNQRAGVDRTLNQLVKEGTGGFFSQTSEKKARELVSQDIDSQRLLRSERGIRYLDKWRKNFRVAEKRNPNHDEEERERIRINTLQKDLGKIRQFESVGRTPDPPNTIDKGLYTDFSADRIVLYEDALAHRNSKKEAYATGFSEGYNSTRANNPFTDETRPWYVLENRLSTH